MQTIIIRFVYHVLFPVLLLTLSYIMGADSISAQLILSLVYLTLPGYIVLQLLKHASLNRILYISETIGVSLSYLMIFGFFINTLLPVFGVSEPIRSVPITFAVNISLLIGSIVVFARKKNLPIVMPIVKTGTLISLVSSICMVIFSTLGAISINNHSTNGISLIILAIIAFILCIIPGKALRDSNKAILLGGIAASLLLMLSMRGNYLTGSDIHDEFYVFQQVMQAGKWTSESLIKAYNACLSITILPTIISGLTHIRGELIYKFIYPILFSVTAINMYYLYRAFAPSKVSALAVVYFVIQPLFVSPMTHLARQEIAFIFYTLFLSSIFSYPKFRENRALTLIFGISIILSHYSTSYIMLLILLASFFISRLFNIVYIRGFKIQPVLSRLSLSLLLLLLVITQFWYFQITQSAKNLTDTVLEASANLNKLFLQENTNQEVTMSLSLGAKQSLNTMERVSDYYELAKKRQILNVSGYYSPETYADYTPEPIYSKNVPPIIPYSYSNTINKILAYNQSITKLYLVLGFLLLLVLSSFYRKNTELVGLTIACFFLLGLFLFHPLLAARYNISRIYLQLLFVLSLPAVYGLYTLFVKIKLVKVFTIIIGSIILVYFYYSGIFTPLIGGLANLSLYNSGHEYDKFYTPKGDVVAAKWFSNNRNASVIINTESYGYLILKSYAQIQSVSTQLIPQSIRKDSYVFLRSNNYMQNKIESSFQGVDITFSLPSNFLYKNKNIIYSNSQSIILK